MTPAAVPDRAVIEQYLGDHSWSPEQLDSALAAETAAQAAACSWVGDAYPVELAEALCRRVARNLAIRGLPLGQSSAVTDAAAVVTPLGRRDPEVDRLEGPYRPVLFG